MEGPARDRRTLSAATVLLTVLGILAAFAASPPPAAGIETAVGGKVFGDIRLSGRVRVTEDLLILPGATVRVAPGTVLVFDDSDSTKVDPEHFFGGVELVVRGTLRATGAEFRFAGRSGGLVVDGGRAELSDVSVSGGEAGISVLGGGRVAAAGPVSVRDCRVGVALFAPSSPAWAGDGAVTLRGNGIGAVLLFPGAALPPSFRIAESEEANRVSWSGVPGPDGMSPPASPPSPGPGALRLADAFIDRDRTLSGDVVVDGVIRVAPGATLTLAPGSRLFFTFRDTDGDGIGESGLFLQGNLRAAGTAGKPVGFYPAESVPGTRGRWDAINFMASDRGENVLTHVVIAGAYRGLHAHFSRLRGEGIAISGCYRGLQFQESEVDLEGIVIDDAVSALRCRDSGVRLARLSVRDTLAGASFLRSIVDLARPSVAAAWYGLRFRESRAAVAGGRVTRGLVGISIQDGSLRADGLVSEEPGLAGFALREGDATMVNCRATGSRIDALSALRARVAVTGGVLSGFGRHAVNLEGPADVTLKGVDLGGRTEEGRVPIRDGKTTPGLGIVKVE